MNTRADVKSWIGWVTAMPFAQGKPHARLQGRRLSPTITMGQVNLVRSITMKPDLNS
jgi:hypothetical protein